MSGCRFTRCTSLLAMLTCVDWRAASSLLLLLWLRGSGFDRKTVGVGLYKMRKIEIRTFTGFHFEFQYSQLFPCTSQYLHSIGITLVDRAGQSVFGKTTVFNIQNLLSF